MNRALLGVLIVIAGCSGGHDEQHTVDCGEPGSMYPCERPLVAVIANPDSYRGRLVRTAGFLSGGDARNILFASREGWAVGDRFSAIVVEVEHTMKTPEFSFVVVTGIIEVNESVRQPNIRIVVAEGADLVKMHSPSDWSTHERGLVTGENEEQG